MTRTRTISDDFIGDLTKTDGFLYPVLERVRKDNTLMIAIRNNYINIYYRGGNILKLTEQSKGSYQCFFDNQYDKTGQPISLPATINTQDGAKIWVDLFQTLKLKMDFYFSVNSKPEREFQQLVARENNDSTISNDSEYFITDIEFADTELKARIDMLAIRWLASERKNGSSCRATLIEMKYGDKALNGAAGLLKHLEDLDKLVLSDRYAKLLLVMEDKFNQLDQLGLLRCSSKNKIKLDVKDKPEVVFILANHNPRSSILKNIITGDEIKKYENSNNFDLKFYVSCFAGYGLHSNCMLTLNEFKNLLKCPPAI